MKIGINLVGLTICEQGSLRWQRPRNWNNYKESIKNNLINCWSNNEIYIYVTTYENDDIQKILDFYKPSKYQFFKLDKSANVNDISKPKEGGHYSQQIKTYIKSLEMIKNENLDFIISTRFDINFFDKISYLNFDFDKFNFLFREDVYVDDLVCDNLFCLPNKYLNEFIDSCNEIYKESYDVDKWMPGLHFMYIYIKSKIGENNINFLTNDKCISHNNKYYTLYT